MKTRIALAILLAATVVVCAAPAARYKVEPTNGTVSFTITKWGVFEEAGIFRDFDAAVLLDREQPARSSVEFTVRTASVDTKNDGRDGTLRSDDFLDVARFPTMTFRSTKVVPRGKDAADVTGNLTIHGVTRSITVPVRLTATGKHPRFGEMAAFETRFSINRLDYGVTGGGWTAAAPGVLANEVKIHIIAGGATKH
ncbi:MAG TPA: YceI family protein [Thermoanaerobaculia bacterium]